MIKFEPNKFLVVNRKHLKTIPTWKCQVVALALKFISDHVPENKYYVCNQDEPYAEKVIAMILKGESIKASNKTAD